MADTKSMMHIISSMFFAPSKVPSHVLIAAELVGTNKMFYASSNHLLCYIWQVYAKLFMNNKPLFDAMAAKVAEKLPASGSEGHRHDIPCILSKIHTKGAKASTL